jgi:TolA-binding protein
MTADPFAVFRVEGGSGRYAVQPRYQPVAVTTGRPKEASFQWFRAGDLDLPLVVTERVDLGDRDRFADVFDETRLQEKIREPTRRPLDAEPKLSETLGRNEIVITGASPGRPLWIRVSYHPNWRVEGADRIWRTAPSFMLVFPTRSTVRLVYGRSFPEYLGLVLTGLAIAAAGVTLIFRKRDAGRRFSPFVLIQKGLRRPAMVLAPRAGWALAGGCLGAGLAALYLIFLVSFEEPGVYFRRGLDYFNAGDLARAREVWLEGVEKFPYSPSVDGSLYHVGLSWLKEKNGPAAREAWQTLIGRYPESRVLPEAWYHVGRTYQMEDRWEEARAAYLEVAHRFPDTDWAQWAGRAMGETLDAQWEQELASAAGDDRNGRWAEAAQEAARLRDQAPDSGRARTAARLAAQAFVRLGRWREAEKAWDAFREADLEGDFEAEALYGMGEARRGAGDWEGAAGFWRRAAEVQPPMAWSEKARDALNTLEGSPEP